MFVCLCDFQVRGGKGNRISCCVVCTVATMGQKHLHAYILYMVSFTNTPRVFMIWFFFPQKKPQVLLWIQSSGFLYHPQWNTFPLQHLKYRKRRYHVVKKRRIDKVGKKNYENIKKSKKSSVFPLFTFQTGVMKADFAKTLLVQSVFTNKKRCPSSLSHSGSEVSLGSVHGVLSFPPPGPHGYFPSMIQEFWGVKGGCCRSAVELKPEIGDLVWSSGALRRSGMRCQSEKSLRWQWARGWNEGTHPAWSNTYVLTHFLVRQ